MYVTHAREVSIAADPTVLDGHSAKADDPQASLRAELLGQLVAAQFDIESAIADLTRDGAPPSATAESRAQLANLGAVRQQLAGADPRTLISMRGDVAAAVAACQTAAQQARTTADATSASNAANIAQSARATVNNVMRGMKDFDSDLRFTNTQDEAEYRRREHERESYIAAEQAKHTPEGDLNAAGAATGQMTDAAAHSATANPEFQKRWDALTTSTARLREQLVRDGKDVSEFDTHLREDLRTIMRSKGLSNEKINALLAAHADNPLDAVKAFVADQKGAISEREIDDFTRKAAEYCDAADNGPGAAETTERVAPMVDAMAKLKAAGVVAADDHSVQPSAPVVVQATANRSSSRSV